VNVADDTGVEAMPVREHHIPSPGSSAYSNNIIRCDDEQRQENKGRKLALVEMLDMRGQAVKDRRNTEEVIHKAVEAAARDFFSAILVLAVQHEPTFMRFATNLILFPSLFRGNLFILPCKQVG
jgi:hypothetical protein